MIAASPTPTLVPSIDWVIISPEIWLYNRMECKSNCRPKPPSDLCDSAKTSGFAVDDRVESLPTVTIRADSYIYRRHAIPKDRDSKTALSTSPITSRLDR